MTPIIWDAQHGIREYRRPWKLWALSLLLTAAVFGWLGHTLHAYQMGVSLENLHEVLVTTTRQGELLDKQRQHVSRVAAIANTAMRRQERQERIKQEQAHEREHQEEERP